MTSDPTTDPLETALRATPTDPAADLAGALDRAGSEGLLDVAYATVDSPIGPLLLAATPTGLVRLGFRTEDHDEVLDDLAQRVSPRVVEAPARLDEVRRQLDEYFEGRRDRFEIPLDWQLSRGFRRTVRERLYTDVGYGQTVSYRELATMVGNPRAGRAVGTAMATNPIPIVVPCHRVLRSGGHLGGYGGGLETKVRLLELEGNESVTTWGAGPSRRGSRSAGTGRRAPASARPGGTARPPLVRQESLSQTLDAVEELEFEGGTLAPDDRRSVARWIAGRQGLPHAKSGTFAGFPSELREGIVVFTGERFTRASARHVLGEEACRVLRWLDVDDPEVEGALERADRGLAAAVALAEHDPRYGHNPGAYCCTRCTVGMWRNLVSGGLDRREERLRRGTGQFLRSRRGDRRWRSFPFWYTVLALTEMDLPEARDELEFVAPVLERTVRRAAPADTYGKRRHEVASRALSAL